MRVRAVIDRWGDGAVALAFAVWTQVDLWKHAPAAMHVVGGRGVLAVLSVLVTVVAYALPLITAGYLAIRLRWGRQPHGSAVAAV